ncbi:guanylate kinase [Flagellatimonas centrodinii]|uniref:guanylate kinase n=1 Tax=Flagellatimonas centrodinii TaxID=2806210 RepID=UPI001FEF392E|nr:guanylate kinase [Flagellatimonas centrodinii]ULQ45423.1 guanylate kinase [Flagellatimonas centrodinii]
MNEAPVPGSLVIVSAPSGGGKTSLTRALVPYLAQRDVRATLSVSYTTRAMRAGEVDGEHYHFVDVPQFRAMIAGDAFLEHAEVFGRHYGTGRASTDALLAAGVDVMLDIDWQGARQVRQRAEAVTSVFILPPSLAELERRLRGRGQDSDEVIARRMREARSEIAHYDEYDHLIVNEDFERSLEALAAIFLERRQRQAMQLRAHPGLIDRLLA